MEMQWPTSVWPIEMIIIITHLKQFEVSKIWRHRATGIQLWMGGPYWMVVKSRQKEPGSRSFTKAARTQLNGD